jgi:hemerythrin
MADFFVWDVVLLGLEIPQMDVEHERLIESMNRVYLEYERAASPRKLKLSVEELVEYTLEHFRHEEAYMAKLCYPGFSKHKLIHAALVERLKEHVTAFERVGALDSEFFSFLRFWLRSHIMGVDKRYAAFTKKPKAPLAR